MCDDNKTSYNNDSNILKQASLKATKKRLMLLSAIRNAGHPITAEEIFDDVAFALGERLQRPIDFGRE